MKKVLNYSSKEELYDLLVEFVHTLYFRYTNALLCLGFYCIIFQATLNSIVYVHCRHLLVSPKDRRVVVVESLLCPTLFRETLAKVFFRHFEVGHATETLS